MLGKVLGTARKWFRQAENPLSDLLPPAQTLKILERERARTDRSGDRFSVLAFSPCAREVEEATWRQLARILQERLRSTDEVGWLEDGQLCAILPDTSSTGARKVADDVCCQFTGETPAPICSIYCYPNEPVGSDDGNSSSGLSPTVLALESLFLRPIPFWKRSLDILGAITGLILLFPLFAIVAAAIKLTSPGPIFFRQLRSGYGGRPFLIWKFRTMVVGAEKLRDSLLTRNEQDGPAFKIRHDPRVTMLGRFLRATSIDELPQLWNVLVGDMSLVGPRPLPCKETDGCVLWQRRRLDVIPGLTCIWQVSGRSKVSFAEWVRMDVRYIQSRSPWQDFKLLLLTLPAVLLRKGAH